MNIINANYFYLLSLLHKHFASGSLAKSGWFRPVSRSYSSFTSLPDKRHVAALARLGWLPSYRSVRRFNRSGRSFLKSNSDDIVCRSRK